VAGIPWQVVTKDDDISKLDVLYTFCDTPMDSYPNAISLSECIDWNPKATSIWERFPALHGLTSKLIRWLYRAYFEKGWFRSLGDRLGVTKLYVASPFFYLPNAGDRKKLVEALPNQFYPRVKCNNPALVELWRQSDKMQLHLVNYAKEATRISVSFGKDISGMVLSPNHEDIKFEGSCFDFILDVYSILIWSSLG
jgi:hypothetical protein